MKAIRRVSFVDQLVFESECQPAGSQLDPLERQHVAMLLGSDAGASLSIRADANSSAEAPTGDLSGFLDEPLKNIEDSLCEFSCNLASSLADDMLLPERHFDDEPVPFAAGSWHADLNDRWPAMSASPTILTAFEPGVPNEPAASAGHYAALRTESETRHLLIATSGSVSVRPEHSLLLPAYRVSNGWQADSLDLNLSVGDGQLHVDSASDSLLFSMGERLEFSGSRVQINQVLSSVFYTPTPGFRGDDCLVVELFDQASGDLLDHTAVLIEVDDEGRTGPQVKSDRLVLRETDELTLDKSQLEVRGISDYHVRFVLDSEPVHGQLRVAGRAIKPGEGFWQHELAAGRVSYRHRPNGGLVDVASFSAFLDTRTDESRTQIGKAMLAVDVIARPKGVVNLGLDVGAAPKVIDQSLLDVLTGGSAQLVIDDLPMSGQLLMDAQPVGVGASLSLVQLGEGRLSYRPDPVSDDDQVFGDSFRFRVIDPVGHTIHQDTFRIRRL